MSEQSEDHGRQDCVDPPKRGRPSRDRPGFKAAQQFIEDHFQNPSISLKALATIAEMPTNTLTRVFQQHLGMSPIRALWAFRCERARSMIAKEPNMPLGEVSVRCGFLSQAHFSRRMKAHLEGTSPANFRKKCGEAIDKNQEVK